MITFKERKTSDGVLKKEAKLQQKAETTLTTLVETQIILSFPELTKLQQKLGGAVLKDLLRDEYFKRSNSMGKFRSS